MDCKDKAHQATLEKSLAEKNGHTFRTDQNTPQTSHQKDLFSSKKNTLSVLADKVNKKSNILAEKNGHTFRTDQNTPHQSMTCMHLKKFKVFSSLRKPETHFRHAQGHQRAGAVKSSIIIFERTTLQ